MDSLTLVADSVVIRFGKNTVLRGGYITSTKGRITGIVGNNGAGKSCLFRALMGGLRVESMMITINGMPIERKDISRFVKYLPQEQLIPRNMKISRVFNLYGVNYWVFVNHFPEFTRYHDDYVDDLSGGNIRLMETCLVLMSNSPFCVLDEPFTQIDPIHIDAIIELIMECSKQRGIVITDHNYNILSRVVEDVFIISDGYTIPVKNQEDLVRLGYLHSYMIGESALN